jgi:hypothetical protein
MEINNKKEKTPEKIINDYIKEQEFALAAFVAKTNKLIDKQIESYDGMSKFWGHMPTKAGNQMYNLGLLGKAKEYFEASGDTDSHKYRDIEDTVSTSPEEFKENSEIIVEGGDYIEEFPFTWELIYSIKEGDQKATQDLGKGVSLKEKVQEDYWNYSGRN